jgi:transposase
MGSGYQRELGATFREIEEMGICSKNSACQIWHKYAATGDVKDRPRKGRPRILDARGERRLIREAISNPTASLRTLKFRMFRNLLSSPDFLRTQSAVIPKKYFA